MLFRFLAAALLLSVPLQAQAPELVVLNARIFTGDSARPWAEAIATRGDRITAIGTTAGLRAMATRATRIVDAGGRLLIPGINDAHVHFGGVPWYAHVDAGTGTPPDPTRAEILAALDAARSRVGAGGAIGITIGPIALEDRALRRAMLDSVAPDRPVLLSAWSGHGVIANSAALRRLGLDTATRDPLGGATERDASGRATGLLDEYTVFGAQRRLWSSQPEEELARGIRQFADGALKYGITSVQNMANALDPALMLRATCAARAPIRVRLIAFPMTSTAGRVLAPWPPRSCGVRAPGDTGSVRVSGVKYILDGTPVERRATLRQPYSDRPTERGILNFPPETLAVILREAKRSREPLLIHAVGDSAIGLVLTTMRLVGSPAEWRPLRVRIEHGDGLTPDLLGIARTLGVVLVQNPTHLAIPGMMAARYGPTRLASVEPLASAARAGVKVALGSDGEINPYLNLMLASIHPNNPKEALTLEEALRAYTSGSAYAEGTEREKGVLRSGMLADFAVLSQDIFAVERPKLPATVSLLTVVGGRIAYDAGALGAAAR